MRKLIVLVIVVFLLGGCNFYDLTKKVSESELSLLPTNAFDVTIQDIPFLSQFDLEKVRLENFVESDGVLYFSVESNELNQSTTHIYAYRWADQTLKSILDFKDANFVVNSIVVMEGEVYFCGHHYVPFKDTNNGYLPITNFEISKIEETDYEVMVTQTNILHDPKLSIFDGEITYLTSKQEESLYKNIIHRIDSSGKSSILWQEYGVSPISLLPNNGFADVKFFYFLNFTKNAERITRLTREGKSEEYLLPQGIYSLIAKDDQIIFEHQQYTEVMDLSGLYVISKNLFKLEVMEASALFIFDPIKIISKNQFLLSITEAEDSFVGSLVIGVKKDKQNAYYYIPKLLAVYGLVEAIVLKDGRILIWGGVYDYLPDTESYITSNAYLLDIKQP